MATIIFDINSNSSAAQLWADAVSACFTPFMEINEMSTPYESANLILKLYDMRRESVMRDARKWFIAEFHPTTVEEISAIAMGEHGAYYRMVTTYWDMACSLVLGNAIDEEMFNNANAEHVACYSKIGEFIDGLREVSGAPNYMQNLQKVVTNIPNVEERMARMREIFKKLKQANAEAAKA